MNCTKALNRRKFEHRQHHRDQQLHGGKHYGSKGGKSGRRIRFHSTHHIKGPNGVGGGGISNRNRSTHKHNPTPKSARASSFGGSSSHFGQSKSNRGHQNPNFYYRSSHSKSRAGKRRDHQGHGKRLSIQNHSGLPKDFKFRAPDSSRNGSFNCCEFDELGIRHEHFVGFSDDDEDDHDFEEDSDDEHSYSRQSRDIPSDSEEDHDVSREENSEDHNSEGDESDEYESEVVQLTRGNPLLTSSATSAQTLSFPSVALQVQERQISQGQRKAARRAAAQVRAANARSEQGPNDLAIAVFSQSQSVKGGDDDEMATSDGDSEGDSGEESGSGDSDSDEELSRSQSQSRSQRTDVMDNDNSDSDSEENLSQSQSNESDSDENSDSDSEDSDADSNSDDEDALLDAKLNKLTANNADTLLPEELKQEQEAFEQAVVTLGTLLEYQAPTPTANQPSQNWYIDLEDESSDSDSDSDEEEEGGDSEESEELDEEEDSDHDHGLDDETHALVAHDEDETQMVIEAFDACLTLVSPQRLHTQEAVSGSESGGDVNPSPAMSLKRGRTHTYFMFGEPQSGSGYGAPALGTAQLSLTQSTQTGVTGSFKRRRLCTNSSYSTGNTGAVVGKVQKCTEKPKKKLSRKLSYGGPRRKGNASSSSGAAGSGFPFGSSQSVLGTLASEELPVSFGATTTAVTKPRSKSKSSIESNAASAVTASAPNTAALLDNDPARLSLHEIWELYASLLPISTSCGNGDPVVQFLRIATKNLNSDCLLLEQHALRLIARTFRTPLLNSTGNSMSTVTSGKKKRRRSCD